MEDPKAEKIDTPPMDEASNEADNEFYVDPVKEVKLLAKLDLAFTPIIMLVYLSCFLDRSNIGNVKVAGMLKDIHATDQQFSTAVSIFYATYVTFETPAAVLMKKVTPLTWLNVNIAPHYRRATAIGFQQTMGNTAGIVAGQIYRTAPYKLGNSFSLGALCLSQVLIAGKVIYVRRQNKLKDDIGSGKREDTRKVSTGDRELDFRYHI
ncbi:putative transporter [Lachnellula willkommii]|uniref:Putative transporter n=1 Tax=Lachnellula willkommii TaxID=215461 RepID=A0A559MCP7_9HELO|nr:putative transporter [Lachnellula willkommii]